MNAAPSHAQRLVNTVGGGRISTSTKTPKFNWERTSATLRYVFFFTGRCGSTWLTSLIESSGLAGAPHELFNPIVANANTKLHGNSFYEYLEKAAQCYTRNNRFGVEIDPERLHDIDDLIGFENIFSPQETSSFLLYRRDIFSQAWSWASARKTGRWHKHVQTISRESEVPGQQTCAETPNITEIITEISRIRRGEEYLASYFDKSGFNPRPIEYESLVTETQGILTSILCSIGVDPISIGKSLSAPMHHGTERLTYTEKDLRRAEFESKHPEASSILSRERMTFSSYDFAAMFSDLNF